MGANTRYIVVRRSDIPNGTLQVLDLNPNESQRNLVYEPPGQTKYLNRFQNDTVTTVVSGGAILARGNLKGVAAYLIDHVEAGGLGAGLAALTATEANDAATAIIALVDAGSDVDIASVNAAIAGVVADSELVATTSASTGNLEELLRILAGAEYVVPTGSILDTDGSTFNPVVSGSFTTGVEREIFNTSHFLLSSNIGELFEMKQATFDYLGTAAPAVVVYDNTGVAV